MASRYQRLKRDRLLWRQYALMSRIAELLRQLGPLSDEETALLKGTKP